MSSMFISSLWDVKEPKHYSRRVGDKVPGVVAVLFSPAEVAGLAVMSLKRLVVYEATKAETATSQKGTLPSAGTCRCRCRTVHQSYCYNVGTNKVNPHMTGSPGSEGSH